MQVQVIICKVSVAARVYNKREESIERSYIYLALNVRRKSRAWNANLLTTFSIYVINYSIRTKFMVYEHNQSRIRSKCVTFRTHSTLHIGKFDTLFSFIVYSW